MRDGYCRQWNRTAFSFVKERTTKGVYKGIFVMLSAGTEIHSGRLLYELLASGRKAALT